MSFVTIEHHLDVLAALQSTFSEKKAGEYSLLYRWGVIPLTRTVALEELANEQFLVKEAALLAIAYEKSNEDSDDSSDGWPEFDGFFEAKTAFLELLHFGVLRLSEAFIHEEAVSEAVKDLEEEWKGFKF